MSIQIVTDSTSDITQARAKELKITVVPLTINFGNEEFIDGITMNNTEFFARLRISKELPKTSQVTVGTFIEVFQRLAINPNDEVIGIFISSELSGTFQSAHIAAETLQNKNIYPIDSRQVTFGLALLVETAIKMRDDGKSAQEIINAIELLKHKVVVHAVIDDLKYLKMGGRLSGTAAMIGQVLRLKPIVEVANGKVQVTHKTLGHIKAYDWMITQYEQADVEKTGLHFLGHSDSPSALKQFETFIKKRIPSFPINGVYEIGITVGTHAGPNCVGLAYFVK